MTMDGDDKKVPTRKQQHSTGIQHDTTTQVESDNAR
jgi:hypothetical protein